MSNDMRKRPYTYIQDTQVPQQSHYDHSHVQPRKKHRRQPNGHVSSLHSSYAKSQRAMIHHSTNTPRSYTHQLRNVTHKGHNTMAHHNMRTQHMMTSGKPLPWNSRQPSRPPMTVWGAMNPVIPRLATFMTPHDPYIHPNIPSYKIILISAAMHENTSSN